MIRRDHLPHVSQRRRAHKLKAPTGCILPYFERELRRRVDISVCLGGKVPGRLFVLCPRHLGRDLCFATKREERELCGTFSKTLTAAPVAKIRSAEPHRSRNLFDVGWWPQLISEIRHTRWGSMRCDPPVPSRDEALEKMVLCYNQLPPAWTPPPGPSPPSHPDRADFADATPKKHEHLQYSHAISNILMQAAG
jgi:hypothetical protein